MRIAAVLLAAGSSRRFGAKNKLLIDIAGMPLVRRAADLLLGLRFSDTIAVTGYDCNAVAATLADLPVRLVHNPDHARGMGSSIAAGIRALSPETEAAMIVPADMPGLSPSGIMELVSAFEGSRGTRVVHAADASGAQRNPVIWPADFFPSLAQLDGPAGGKALIPWDRAIAVTAPGAALADIDTPDDLKVFVQER